MQKYSPFFVKYFRKKNENDHLHGTLLEGLRYITCVACVVSVLEGKVEMAKKVEIKDVRSVYSGKARSCACGCCGKHKYASALVFEANKNRGYEITADEVSDRSVAIIVGKINRAAEAGEKIDEHLTYFAYENESRLYVAYLSAAAVAARTEALVVN